MLGTCDHLLDKAEAFCGETGCGHGDVIAARLYEDMLPFAYQIKSVGEHTAGAIVGVRNGVFSPAISAPPADFSGLRSSVTKARDTLLAVTEEEMESFIGRPMRFEFKDVALPFTAEDFLFSFSQPNFYFHAATAYDILRMKGVQIGKRDFMGALRIRTS